MKKRFIMLLVLVMFFLSACGHANDDGTEDFQSVSLKDIDILQVDHGSVKLNVESADIDSLEASLLLYDNGPGIVMDKSKRKIKIRLKNDVSRLLKIGQMPQLQVRIPSDYMGQVVVDGSSGSVTARELETHSLQITGKSGNISLDFAKFHSDIRVSVTSGNVKVSLNEVNPDVSWILQSGSGRRSITIPLEDHRQNNRKTEGQSGSGSYEVHLKTSSGNISVQ
ncbi:DUF4097 family beta strand repeat-containing protein [Paenibacillus sp. MER TA 81-3]|uniref:DUF4097 family beta strand repeat-containing protein n=1 Tax=Paenibacillus sp. MER TA 81-3 TaxID=2939573 RepID=UPI00203AEBBD|nr:DUF4097 family beta strand repeat-containing protein [Paenibacillus sp. MER TA 81-3]MCM3342559.1 DUF4097 family beta strand repeat-containing protein [Paenibacillus sp. MER TA 81-3]